MGIILYIYLLGFLSWLVFEGFLIFKDWRRDQSHAQDNGTLWWLKFCIALAFLGGFSFITYTRQYNIDSIYFIYFGTLIIYLGIFIRAWAVHTLGRSFQRVIIADENQQTTTKGPFKYLRHPSYLGLFLSVIGIVGFWGNYAGILFTAVALLCGLVPRIILEEQYLSQTLGESYKNFIHKVKWRLFPYIW